jgi:hypothetical protein
VKVGRIDLGSVNPRRPLSDLFDGATFRVGHSRSGRRVIIGIENGDGTVTQVAAFEPSEAKDFAAALVRSADEIEKATS